MKMKKKRALGAALGITTLMAMPAQQAAFAQQASETFTLMEAQAYDKVANVQGEFNYNQNVLTPADDVFNLFGTAATGLCAAPGFAFDKVEQEDYYLNIRGTLKKTATVYVKELMEDTKEEKSKVLACSCGMSAAIANAEVKGVLLEDVLPLEDILPGTNTITVKDKSGYGLALPLNYVLDKQAMLVWNVGGEELTSQTGGPVQLWVPDTIAKYFTRQVVDIELSQEEAEPAVQTADAEHRAKVNILNQVDERAVFSVGDKLVFEGYADDAGQPIAAVEFSLDGGETWTAYETKDTTSEKWVYWYFGYTCEAEGSYKLDVRARTEDGLVSPLAASVVFKVSK
jgi:DMSO/TMAO reductase YedYZ molybdopterin-dependent catalytic subunit